MADWDDRQWRQAAQLSREISKARHEVQLAARRLQRLVLGLFLVGLGLALWQVTRPMPSPLLVVLAVALMVPQVAAWYRVRRL